MDLRDRIAITAMQSILADYKHYNAVVEMSVDKDVTVNTAIATICYNIADAMMEVRNKDYERTTN